MYSSKACYQADDTKLKKIRSKSKKNTGLKVIKPKKNETILNDSLF